MNHDARHRIQIEFVATLAMTGAMLLAGAGGVALAGTNTVTFSAAREHHIVIPSGVTSLHVVAVGGRGGGGNYQVPGGFGARVVGDLAVTPGQSRYLQVGGNGTYGLDFGGAGGGAGASDVRLTPASAGLTPTDSRVLIAAGGGGSGRGVEHGADGTAGIGGDAGTPGGNTRGCPQCEVFSGGGRAGVPTGTGEGGTSGANPGNPTSGDVGAAGTLGVGGAGAFKFDEWPGPAPGGYNGGGVGGGGTFLVGGEYLTWFGGGGGGGGLNGGGGGGGSQYPFGRAAAGGGGGGGGSNLVPAGGSASIDTTGNGSITVSFADSAAPVVSVDQPQSPSARLNFKGTSGTVLGDGGVTIKVYAGASPTGAPIGTKTATRNAGTGAWDVSLFDTLPNGQYTVQATQDDGAGNVGTSTARTFMLDMTVPTISLTTPAGGSQINDATPEFTGVGGTAPGDSATVSVLVYSHGDGGPLLVQTPSGQRDGATGAYAFSASPALADGTYMVFAYQLDAAGNGSATELVTFTIETLSPAPTLTTPAADARTNDATPSFAGGGTTAAGDNSTVAINVYSGVAPSGTAVATLNATLDADRRYQADAATPLADGTYTVQTTQMDAAGNIGTSAARTFTVDTVAPAVTLVAPTNGAAVGSSPTFAGVAGAAPGDDATATVKVYAGGAAAGTVVQTLDPTRDPATGAYSVPAAFALRDGTYTAQATQLDDVGNAGASTASTFTVGGPGDTPPPAVTPPGVTPPGAGPGVLPDRRPPVLSRTSLTNRRFRVGASRARRLATGTTVRYTLSEPATVTITIARAGRARAVGRLKRNGAAGANRVRFTGRIGRKALKPGRYVMTVGATDAARNRSKPRRLTFRIG